MTKIAIITTLLLTISTQTFAWGAPSITDVTDFIGELSAEQAYFDDRRANEDNMYEPDKECMNSFSEKEREEIPFSDRLGMCD